MSCICRREREGGVVYDMINWQGPQNFNCLMQAAYLMYKISFQTFSFDTLLEQNSFSMSPNFIDEQDLYIMYE